MSITRRNAIQVLSGALAWVIAACRPSNGKKPKLPELWEKLQESIPQSQVIPRDDGRYANAWYKVPWIKNKPQRYPAAIVIAASGEDVRKTVAFAREQKLRVAVRGGGHNWNAAQLRDGGILVDLQRLTGRQIDVRERIMECEPVVGLHELADSLARHGLAFPVGHCPGVPLSGFLVAGGWGWNFANWGPSAASIESMDIVTADGELRRCSESENAELFWAARGSGSGFFGIVTKYRLRLYPLPKAIRLNFLAFELDDTEAAAKWLGQQQPGMNPGVETGCFIVQLDALLFEGLRIWEWLEGLPEQKEKKIFLAMAVAFADSDAQAKEWVKPLRKPPVKPILTWWDQPVTIQELKDIIGIFFPPGKRYAANVAWTAPFDQAPLEKVVSVVKEQLERAPSRHSFTSMVLAPGNAPAPPPPTQMPPMAVSMTGAINAGIYTAWDHEGDDARNRQWIVDTTKALEPYTVGYYIGEVDLTYSHDIASRCYLPQAWPEIERLKKKYDPENRFFWYLNQPEP